MPFATGSLELAPPEVVERVHKRLRPHAANAWANAHEAAGHLAPT